MNHVIEQVAAGVTVVCLGALVWIAGPPTPRPKPEEFVMPPVEFVEPSNQSPTVTIRLRPQTQQQRVDQVVNDLNAAQRDLGDIKRALKDKRAKSEDGGS